MRRTGKPKLFSAFMVWNTTLLCSVPPNNGCGWHTSAACVAFAAPAFSSASRRPAGPSRKKERMVEFELTTPDYTIAPTGMTRAEHGRGIRLNHGGLPPRRHPERSRFSGGGRDLAREHACRTEIH